jgi:beta-glucosidase
MTAASSDYIWNDSSLPLAERVNALLAEMTVEEKLDQLNYRNKGVERLGIQPHVWWNEALHGLARSGGATVFPQAIAMAATFSPELVQKMGDVIALEGRARHHECARKGDFGTYKGLTYFSPNVNIFRDPRWGRGHETYGEDPYLTGIMGAAFVRGVQGDHPTYLKAVATPKHYAVHSGPEATRLSFNSIADERDLRETYLPAFKACFDAGARSVMTAYNAYNGTACTLNTYLINDILRGEWGFDVTVVTDAGAGEALYKEHKVVKDYPEATAKELAAGIDVIVDWEEGVHDAYQQGLITDDMIDRALYNQFKTKIQLGMFDDPSDVPLADTDYDVIECDAHRELSRQATRESVVLMKNENNILPLNKKDLSSIAVIGPNADSREILLGNYFGTPTRHSTILEGIIGAVPDTCRVWHAKGCEHIGPRTEGCAEDHDRFAEAVTVAERSDVAILCLGLSPTIEGEAGDAFNAEASGDKLRIELPDIQETLVQKITATGTPVVVLMVTGSAMISPGIESSVPAMLQCWYPGAEGGDVIADLLFGDANPSGKLPLTFYNSTDDLPEFTSYDMTNRTYRFFTGEPAYPFGFGLSYTTFDYSDLTLNNDSNGVRATVTVTNLGDRDGDEIVQAYA